MLQRRREAAAEPAEQDAPGQDGASSAFQKVFSVLAAIVASEYPISLAELEFRVGAPKTSIHRSLQQLETSGLILRDVSGRRFRPAGRLRAFALNVLVGSARVSGVTLALRNLVANIGESCNFGVLSGTEVVYLDRVECRWPLRNHLTPGSKAPVYCTGIGKLMLAYMPRRERDNLLAGIEFTAFTPNTLSDPGRLKQELEIIRAEEVSCNNQEYIAGMVAVAVPIRAEDGRVVAGLALEAPIVRLDLEAARRLVPDLRDTARVIADALAEDGD